MFVWSRFVEILYTLLSRSKYSSQMNRPLKLVIVIFIIELLQMSTTINKIEKYDQYCIKTKNFLKYLLRIFNHIDIISPNNNNFNSIIYLQIIKYHFYLHLIPSDNISEICTY